MNYYLDHLTDPDHSYLWRSYLNEAMQQPNGHQDYMNNDTSTQTM